MKVNARAFFGADGSREFALEVVEGMIKAGIEMALVEFADESDAEACESDSLRGVSDLKKVREALYRELGVPA